MTNYEGEESKEAFTFIAAMLAMVIIWLIARTVLSFLNDYDIERSNKILCNHLYEYTGDYIACIQRGIIDNLEDVKLTYKKGENPRLYEKVK